MQTNFFRILKLFTGQTTDVCFYNAQSQKVCYKNFGLGSWTKGNEKCQELGGRLPTVTTQSKMDFLKNTFIDKFWIGLTTDATTYVD